MTITKNPKRRSLERRSGVGREMRIGELAAQTGVTTRALRYYEQQGLIQPRRRANGYREYDADVVTRVYNIRTLMDSGLTSEDIRELGPCLDRDLDHEPECAEAIALFEHRLHAVRKRVNALLEVLERLEGQLRLMQAHSRREEAGLPLRGDVRSRREMAAVSSDGSDMELPVLPWATEELSLRD